MKNKESFWFTIRRYLHSLLLMPKFFLHRYRNDKLFQLRVDILIIAATAIFLLFKYMQCKGQ